jgi:hypothetical protein
MQGWIKLHRAIMKSETFSKLTAVQKLIAIYIILEANHEDGTWYDKYKDITVPIKRGQAVVSRNKIANEWFKDDKDVTEQKVRTALKKLERFGFLTMKPTSNYTLVEVLNYNVYQSKDKETNQVNNQEETKSQPSDNQVSTTNKNDKNVKEELYIVFDHWISKEIIKHKSLNGQMKSHINARLGEHGLEAVLKAIDNYSEVLKEDNYYWSHTWTLQDLMKPNNLIRFTEEAKPLETFRNNKNQQPEQQKTNVIEMSPDIKKRIERQKELQKKAEHLDYQLQRNPLGPDAGKIEKELDEIMEELRNFG